MTTTELKISKQFENGFHFSCMMCGSCCRGFDEGEVYVYYDDITRLVKHLNNNGHQYTLTSFCRKLLKLVDESFYWKEKDFQHGKRYKYKTLGFKFTSDDEHCYFLKNNICSVHLARPYQCRAFPIGWNMLIKSPKNVKEYSKKCPALKNSSENIGNLHPKKELLKWAKGEYNLEKKFFLQMKANNFNILKVYPFLTKEMVNDS